MKLIVNVPALDDAELSGVLALEQQERLSVRKAQRKPRDKRPVVRVHGSVPPWP